MENPDIVIELERNEDDFITKLSYKVNDSGKDNIKSMEAVEIMATALRAEGPEDHSIRVDFRLGNP